MTVLLLLIFQKYEDTQYEIFSYFEKHNLHTVVTEMMYKAFESQDDNPTMVMADYLLDLHRNNMKKRSRQTMVQELETYKAQSFSEADQNEIVKRRNEALERHHKAYPDLQCNQPDTSGEPSAKKPKNSSDLKVMGDSEIIDLTESQPEPFEVTKHETSMHFGLELSESSEDEKEPVTHIVTSTPARFAGFVTELCSFGVKSDDDMMIEEGTAGKSDQVKEIAEDVEKMSTPLQKLEEEPKSLPMLQKLDSDQINQIQSAPVVKVHIVRLSVKDDGINDSSSDVSTENLFIDESFDPTKKNETTSIIDNDQQNSDEQIEHVETGKLGSISGSTSDVPDEREILCGLDVGARSEQSNKSIENTIDFEEEIDKAVNECRDKEDIVDIEESLVKLGLVVFESQKLHDQPRPFESIDAVLQAMQTSVELTDEQAVSDGSSQLTTTDTVYADSPKHVTTMVNNVNDDFVPNYEADEEDEIY